MGVLYIYTPLNPILWLARLGTQPLSPVPVTPTLPPPPPTTLHPPKNVKPLCWVNSYEVSVSDIKKVTVESKLFGNRLEEIC